MQGIDSRETDRKEEIAKSEALRILMVAPQPFFRPRGTPFSVLHRIRALVSQGHRVDLVTYPFGEDIELPGLRILRSARPALVKDVRIGPSVAKFFLDLKLYAKTKEVLAQGQYDVLHTHEEAAFFGVRLARKHGLLHVYDMHSSLPQQLGNFKAYDFGLLRGFFRRLERKVLRTANGVITICQDLADVAVADTERAHHAMIENTGDDGAIFKADGLDPRAELGLRDKRIALYTGTFEAYQGLDLLLDAFAKVHADLPSAHLILVGGRPEQVDEYRQRSDELGLGDAVTFVGTVHPSRIPAYVNAADLIVSPRTRGTNTPLKIYACLRSGVPLVATDLPTHTQILSQDIALLVPPTPTGFAEGIHALLDDPERSRNLGESAQRFAQEHLSDEAYLAKVTGFYERVLAAARGS